MLAAMSLSEREFEVIVVGGGHAGVEAAWACANAAMRVALVTLDPARIGVMSCNPAIGGLAKGQIVREVDALGGLMALAADATGISFKVLNTSKGAAVHGPRAQCDKLAYADEVQRLIDSREAITIVTGAVERVIVHGAQPNSAVAGVEVVRPDGERLTLHAPSVVLTTGTFMRGLMHTGESQTPGGRINEAPALGISASLRNLGFLLGRLKTGTPPRLRRSTIDWNSLEPQFGDETPVPFSDLTDRARFPRAAQVDCRITRTTPFIHNAIRANLHRAPMYSGQIASPGPRYCPSIEDKVVRFADRDAHHVFLEPESHATDWIYCNGISTSLPKDVQDLLVRGLPGCERAEILQYGYAVEYDMTPPHQIDATAMTKRIQGLFLAGQINGTSGYEEAAGQGVIAGINAARHAAGRTLITLGRDQAYIGVMMDDLVTRTPREPYRMFTSRAEHRLLLRADNAADRLTPLARQWGVVSDQRWARFERRRDALDAINLAIDTGSAQSGRLRDRTKAPDFTTSLLRDSLRAMGLSEESLDQSTLVTALAQRQYEGYIRRQQAQTRRQAEMERRRLPPSLDPAAVQGLRAEAREALTKYRPATIGQAGRLEGITPADLTLVLLAMSRLPNQTAASNEELPPPTPPRNEADPPAGTPTQACVSPAMIPRRSSSRPAP